jgi:hypothetical protein
MDKRFIKTLAESPSDGRTIVDVNHWSLVQIQEVLITVFRFAILGGLETNPGPVNPETVAALFDHLIDLASAQTTAPNKNKINSQTAPIQNNTNNPPPQTPDGNHHTYNTTNDTNPQEGAHHA